MTVAVASNLSRVYMWDTACRKVHDSNCFEKKIVGQDALVFTGVSGVTSFMGL